MNGINYSATDCCIRVLELAPDNKEQMLMAWNYLHQSAGEIQYVAGTEEPISIKYRVNGIDYDERACGGEMMRYIELAPEAPSNAYKNTSSSSARNAHRRVRQGMGMGHR